MCKRQWLKVGQVFQEQNQLCEDYEIGIFKNSKTSFTHIPVIQEFGVT